MRMRSTIWDWCICGSNNPMQPSPVFDNLRISPLTIENRYLYPGRHSRRESNTISIRFNSFWPTTLVSDLPSTYLDGLQSLHERALKDSGNSLSTSHSPLRIKLESVPPLTKFSITPRPRRVSGGALNPTLNIPAIEAQILSEHPRSHVCR